MNAHAIPDQAKAHLSNQEKGALTRKLRPLIAEYNNSSPGRKSVLTKKINEIKRSYGVI